MKKTLLALFAAVVLVFTLSACTEESYTFEAVPVGVNDDDAEDGLTRQQVEDARCFTIEADAGSGDDGDLQLGVFCLDEQRSDDGRDDDQDDD